MLIANVHTDIKQKVNNNNNNNININNNIKSNNNNKVNIKGKYNDNDDYNTKGLLINEITDKHRILQLNEKEFLETSLDELMLSYGEASGGGSCSKLYFLFFLYNHLFLYLISIYINV
jgi:hypothetical protein